MTYDDQPMTQREEFAAMKREIDADILARAEQIARIDREAAANAHRHEAVTKSYDPPPAPRRATPAPAPDWSNYIDTRVKQGDQRITRILTEAVGETLADVRKQLRAEFDAKLEAEVAALKIQFLQQQLDATRSVPRLKSVPPAQIA